MINIFKTKIPEHLIKRAAEIREELEISAKVGVYKEIAKCIEWMPPDYKEELIEILRWVEKNGY